MKKFLESNDTRYRLWRTIIQGIVGVLIANVDMLVGSFNIPVEYKPMIVALVMAVLSPIMSELGSSMSDTEEQTTYNHDEFLEMIDFDEESEDEDKTDTAEE